MKTEDFELELIVSMAKKAWETQNERVTKLIDKLSEEQLGGEVAPSRNTGIYLFGHLIAVNDNLLPLFGFSERLYPQLDEVFLKNPDKSGLQKPSASELKAYWGNVNARLTEHMAAMKPQEWLQRHSAVSEADFAKEPNRNKLNVLMNRTSHQAYHLGQMVLL
jgi:hypothetical protein